MKRIGIQEIVIVVGHLGYEISRHLGDGEKLGVKLRYFEQKVALGIAHAVGQVEEYIDGPFLLMLGDTFLIMDENALSPIEVFRKTGASAVLTVIDDVPSELIRRSFCVIRGENDRVKRVIEKPRHAPTNTIGTGIYCFDPAIFDAIRRTPRTAMRDEYEITDSIQMLIDFELPVVTTTGVHWLENVTYPQDIIRCNLELMKYTGVRKFIGKDVSIHPEATIERSSIGDNSSIDSPTSVTDSVILPGSTVRSDGEISFSIVTPENVINLSHAFGKKT